MCFLKAWIPQICLNLDWICFNRHAILSMAPPNTAEKGSLFLKNFSGTQAVHNLYSSVSHNSFCAGKITFRLDCLISGEGAGSSWPSGLLKDSPSLAVPVQGPSLWHNDIVTRNHYILWIMTVREEFVLQVFGHKPQYYQTNHLHTTLQVCCRMIVLILYICLPLIAFCPNESKARLGKIKNSKEADFVVYIVSTTV